MNDINDLLYAYDDFIKGLKNLKRKLESDIRDRNEKQLTLIIVNATLENFESTHNVLKDYVYQRISAK